MNDVGLMVVDVGMPALSVEQALSRYRQFNSFVSQVLVENRDFGKVPGTDKNTLLKPGAEKIKTFFGFANVFQDIATIEDWSGKEHDGEPFFYYRQKCVLSRNGVQVAEADGSCNSREVKYRYRQGERTCPKCHKNTIVKGKEEYGGGWLCFAKKGGCGAKYKDGDQAIEGQQVGRVLNPDIADVANTVLKQAQKRALVAAVLIGANASDYFTQDVEDLPGFGVIEAEYRAVDEKPAETPAETPAPEPPPAPQAKQAAPTAQSTGHWIDDNEARKRFWPHTKRLRLTAAEVHAALGVEHVWDYAGTEQQAIETVEKYAEANPK